MRTAIVSDLFKSYLISLLSSNSFRMNGVCAINSDILKIGALLIISTLSKTSTSSFVSSSYTISIPSPISKNAGYHFLCYLTAAKLGESILQS